MRKFMLLIVACVGMSCASYAAGSDYYSLTYSTTTGKATEKISGLINIAASSSTPNTPTIVLDGAGGTITASTITASTITASTITVRGEIVLKDGTIIVSTSTFGGGGGGGTPGGSNSNIQYNDSGSFAGASDFNYSPSTGVTASSATITQATVSTVTVVNGVKGVDSVVINSTGSNLNLYAGNGTSGGSGDIVFWVSSPTVAGIPGQAIYSQAKRIVSNTAIVYANVMGGSTLTNLLEDAQFGMVPTTGTWNNLYATVNPAPGIGQSVTVIFRVNGVDTGLTCVISDLNTSCSDASHIVTTNQGDTVSYSVTPTSGISTNSVINFSANFSSTISNKMIVMANSIIVGNGTRWAQIVGNNQSPVFVQPGGAVISPPGTFSSLQAKVVSGGSLGAGSLNYAFETGTSSSTLNCTITYPATSCSDFSNSTATVAGQIVDYVQVATSVSNLSINVMKSMVFTPTNTGEYPIILINPGVTTGGTSFNPISGPGYSTIVESSVTTTGQLSTIKNLYVAFSTGGVVEAGGSDTVTLRSNFSNTALTCTISGSSTTCSNTVDSITIANGDQLASLLTQSGAQNLNFSIGYTGLSAPINSSPSTYFEAARINNLGKFTAVSGVGEPDGTSGNFQYNNDGAFAGASDVNYSSSTGVTASTMTVSSSTLRSVTSSTITVLGAIVWPDGTVQVSSPSASGGSGAPSGSSGNMQYNAGGSFGGASDVNYSASTGVTASTMTVSSFTASGYLFSPGTSTLFNVVASTVNAASMTATNINATNFTSPSVAVSSANFSARIRASYLTDTGVMFTKNTGVAGVFSTALNVNAFKFDDTNGLTVSTMTNTKFNNLSIWSDGNSASTSNNITISDSRKLTSGLSNYGNIQFGMHALENFNGTGTGNFTSGNHALNYLVSGTGNFAAGNNALSVSTASPNYASGNYAGNLNTAGTYNTFSGNYAGSDDGSSSPLTGSYNSFFGYNARTSTGTIYNSMALGANTTVSTSSTVVVGSNTISVILNGAITNPALAGGGTQCLQTDTNGLISASGTGACGSGGGGSPGGASGNMQYNNDGAFAGASDVNYSTSTGVTASTMTVLSMTANSLAVSNLQDLGIPYINGSSVVTDSTSLNWDSGTLSIGGWRSPFVSNGGLEIYNVGIGKPSLTLLASPSASPGYNKQFFQIENGSGTLTFGISGIGNPAAVPTAGNGFFSADSGNRIYFLNGGSTSNGYIDDVSGLVFSTATVSLATLTQAAITSTATFSGPIISSGSVGSAGQVLTSNGAGNKAYWSTVSGGGGGIVSPGTFTWTNNYGIAVSTLAASEYVSASSYVTVGYGYKIGTTTEMLGDAKNIWIGPEAGAGDSFYASSYPDMRTILIGYKAHLENLAPMDGSVAIGVGARITTEHQMVIGGGGAASGSSSSSEESAINDVYIGNGPVNPVPQSAHIHATGGDGTDTQAGDITIDGGISTGNATPGRVIVRNSVVGASGTTPQSQQNTLTIGSTGITSLVGYTGTSGSFSSISASTITITSSATVNRITASSVTLNGLSNTILAVNGSGVIVSTTVTGGGGVAWGGITGTLSNQTDLQNQLTAIANSTTTLQSNITFSSYTVTTTTITLNTTVEVVFSSATSTGIGLTLPTAVGNGGKTYRIKKVDTSSNAITILTTSSQLIDGATSLILTYYGQAVDIISDGFNWFIF